MKKYLPKVGKPILLILMVISANSPLFASPNVLADPAPLQQAENQVASQQTTQANCSDTTTGGSVDQSKVQNCLTQSPVVSDIQKIVDFLSIGVGIIVTGVILVGGIQYIIAGDSPQALQAARQRITNGVIALVAFLFIFAFLQWLIPGGIFQ